MAAVGTQTRTKDLDGAQSITYAIRWTTASGGTATSGWPMAYRYGYLQQVKIVPDSGATQPDDSFDATLVDEDGTDLLAGQGANLSNAAPTALVLNPAVLVTQKLDFQVAAGGDANSGYTYLTIGGQR